MPKVNPKSDNIGITAIEFLGGYKVHLTFNDGTEREIDLEPYLRGPVFEPIRSDAQMFRSVFVDPEWQCLAWSNGADIDPDALYYDGPPLWAETAPDGSPLMRAV